MKYLLDTHTFIWWDSQPSLLSSNVLALLHDPAHDLLLSNASVWEMQIKSQLGKLELGLSLRELIESQQRVNQIELLPIHLEHVLAVGSLPLHHRDPFDRMLIAQAVTEDATLVSKDSAFAKYQLPVIW